MAFTKQGSVLVWIDAAARLLMIDAGSQGKADEVMTCLAKSVDGLGAVLVQTTISPVAAMSDWLLSQEPPAGFSIDRECELKAGDDSKAVVRYSRHALDIEEVQQHITNGKLPTRLALTWEGRISFVLTEGLQIKKLAFVEGVFQDDAYASKDDRFDADAAIATGEISKLIPDLLRRSVVRCRLALPRRKCLRPRSWPRRRSSLPGEKPLPQRRRGAENAECRRGNSNHDFSLSRFRPRTRIAGCSQAPNSYNEPACRGAKDFFDLRLRSLRKR